MKNIIIIILVLVLVGGLMWYLLILKKEITSFEECIAAGYGILESYPRQCRTHEGRIFIEELENKNDNNKEQICIDSGGVVRIAMCCLSTNDFPNLCLIGACGCSLENSHEIKICDCGEEKCFDGKACMSQ